MNNFVKVQDELAASSTQALNNIDENISAFGKQPLIKPHMI